MGYMDKWRPTRSYPQPGTRHILPLTSSVPLFSFSDTTGDMRLASKACICTQGGV